MSISNVKCVQEIYQAFGRGDVAAIVSRCVANTSWGFAADVGAPWQRPARSAAELPRFFADIAENVEFEQFEPREFLHSGEHVVVEVRLAYIVKRTGRRVAMTQVHWWTLDDGQVVRLVHYEDSAQVAAAIAA